MRLNEKQKNAEGVLFSLKDKMSVDVLDTIAVDQE